jgi:hypothetical protein
LKDLEFKLHEISDEKIREHLESVQDVESDRRISDFYGQGLKVVAFEVEVGPKKSYTIKVPGFFLGASGRFYFFTPPAVVKTQRIYRPLISQYTASVNSVFIMEDSYNKFRLYNSALASSAIATGYYVYKEE